MEQPPPPRPDLGSQRRRSTWTVGVTLAIALSVGGAVLWWGTRDASSAPDDDRHVAFDACVRSFSAELGDGYVVFPDQEEMSYSFANGSWVIKGSLRVYDHTVTSEVPIDCRADRQPDGTYEVYWYLDQPFPL